MRTSMVQNIKSLPDATAPNKLVKPQVNAYIIRVHLLLGELADLLDGTGCFPLETDSMKAGMEVDGVFPGYHLVDGRLALLSLATRHLQ